MVGISLKVPVGQRGSEDGGQGGGEGDAGDGEDENGRSSFGVADILHHEIRHDNAEDCLDFCARVYQWDLRKLVRSLHLDLYSCIRLANFLRKEVAQRRAADKALTDEELLSALKLPFAYSSAPRFLDDDALLYPFLDDDELLSALCQESVLHRAEMEAGGGLAMPHSQRPPLQDAEGALLWEAGAAECRAERWNRARDGPDVEGIQSDIEANAEAGAAIRIVDDDSDELSSAGSSLCVSPRLLAAHTKHAHAAAEEDEGGAGGCRRIEAEAATEHRGEHSAGVSGSADAGHLEWRARLRLAPISGLPAAAAHATPSLALPVFPSPANTNATLDASPGTPASPGSFMCVPHRTDSDVSRRSLVSNAIVTPATPGSPPTSRRPVPSPPNPTPVSLLPGLWFWPCFEHLMLSLPAFPGLSECPRCRGPAARQLACRRKAGLRPDSLRGYAPSIVSSSCTSQK